MNNCFWTGTEGINYCECLTSFTRLNAIMWMQGGIQSRAHGKMFSHSVAAIWKRRC